jgi:hypothetical protein
MIAPMKVLQDRVRMTLNMEREERDAMRTIAFRRDVPIGVVIREAMREKAARELQDEISAA